MVVAGYVALAGALSHPLPMRVALSAAFLLQNAAYLVLVLVLPLLTSGPIRPGVALAILALPCVAVVPDVLLRRRSPTRPRTRAVSPRRRLRRDRWRGDDRGRPPGRARRPVRLRGVDRQRRRPLPPALRPRRACRGRPARPGLHVPAAVPEALTALLADTHGRAEGSRPASSLEHDLHVLAQVSIALDGDVEPGDHGAAPGVRAV